MDQEISFQEQACRTLVTLFCGGSEAVRVLRSYLDVVSQGAMEDLNRRLDSLLDQVEDQAIRKEFHGLVDHQQLQELMRSVPEEVKAQGVDAPLEQLADRLSSSEAGFLADLLSMARGKNDLFAVRLLDVILQRAEVAEFSRNVERFVFPRRELSLDLRYRSRRARYPAHRVADQYP